MLRLNPTMADHFQPRDPVTHPTPPALPPTGTQLPPDQSEQIVERFRSWSAQTGSRLLDLDGLLTTLPRDAQQDHTLAFVLWQATDAAIAESKGVPTGTADARFAALRRPLVAADGSTLAANVVEAANIICALIDVTQSRIDAHAGTLAATAGVSADLAAAAPLVKSLSMNAAMHRRLLERSVDPTVLAAPQLVAELVAEAAKLRTALEAADRERSQLLAAHAVEADQVALLRSLATEATEAAKLAAEKISGLPRRGIVSVDALPPPPDVATMIDGPWPALRSVLVERAAKLQRAEQSLRHVINTSRAALAERNELRQVVDAFRAKAMASRIGEIPQVNSAYQAARQLLWVAPTDLAAARQAVKSYQDIVGAHTTNATKPTTEKRSTSEVHR